MLKKVALFAALLLASPVFAQSQGSEQVQQALGKGIWPFLAVSFVGGLIALLTPCVFPMVPVTVSFFAKRKDRPLLSALIYAFGIISTFALLGVLASVIFGAAGIARFATNPWVNIGLAVLFVVLALNLFGVYEFRMDFAGRLQGKAMGKKDSLLSPWLVGIAFSLTTFTCTGPIVAGLLAVAAAGKGGAVDAMLGMTSFGIAFSLPFFFLALFPSALSKAPKGGDWLGVVKPALGFIELAAALKFLSNADLVWQLGILTRPVFVMIWAVMALGLAVFLFGLPKKFKETGWVRRGFAALSLIAAILLFLSPHGQRLTSIEAFLPADPYPYQTTGNAAVQAVAARTEDSGSVPAGPITFLSSYQKALTLAKQENKPVFVDFTGVTCTNCRWMEANVFPDPEVHKLLSSMVTVQLYTDRGTDADNANQELQQKIGGTIALPVYVLVSPEGKVIKTFEGRSDTTQQFASFLKQAASS